MTDQERYRTFHLGDLLSVTTDHLLAPTLLEGVNALLTHVTGDTWESDIEMVEISLRARGELLRQHPWLAYAVPPDGDDPNDRNERVTWFAREIVSRGAYHEVIGAEVAAADVDEAVELVTTDGE